MSKSANSFAFFDVAKNPLFVVISKWRENELGGHFATQQVTGTFSRCTGTTTGEMATWRTQHAPSARLLSVFSHGTNNAVLGCTNTSDVYLQGNIQSGAYPEVEGAIIHLLACATFPELSDALVTDGKASAVIGYDDLFAVRIPDDEEPTDEDSPLPRALESTLRFDAKILEGLAEGKTVHDAVDEAFAWGKAEVGALEHVLATTKFASEAAYVAVVWRLANLTSNLDKLNYCGSKTDTL